MPKIMQPRNAYNLVNRLQTVSDTAPSYILIFINRGMQ